MSKITAKNLQYNTSLPPFLARLRGQHVSDNGGPDPILAAQRRPTKPRSGSAEAEDAPVIVDERGNVVSDVSVGVDGVVKEKEPGVGEAGKGEEGAGTGEGGEAVDKDGEVAAAAVAGEKIAGVGDGGVQKRKRKVGRVIGADAEEEEDVDGRHDKKGKLETDGAKGQGDSAPAAKPKTKKKAKKIKLSFGDDEG